MVVEVQEMTPPLGRRSSSSMTVSWARKMGRIGRGYGAWGVVVSGARLGRGKGERKGLESGRVGVVAILWCDDDTVPCPVGAPPHYKMVYCMYE